MWCTILLFLNSEQLAYCVTCSRLSPCFWSRNEPIEALPASASITKCFYRSRNIRTGELVRYFFSVSKKYSVVSVHWPVRYSELRACSSVVTLANLFRKRPKCFPTEALLRPQLVRVYWYLLVRRQRSQYVKAACCLLRERAPPQLAFQLCPLNELA